MKRPNLRRLVAAGTATALAMVTISACSTSAEPETIQFLSLAWQEASIAANKQIVKDWNEANPDIQIEYVQGSWDSAHDQLLSSFETGDAPDIVHYEAALSSQFAQLGYLADLTELLPEDLKSEIGANAWETVTTAEGAITAVPFLFESQVVIANKKLLDEAEIEVPTIEDPWTWDEFAANAKALTDSDTFGTAWPLKQPVNRVLNLSLNFDGEYFDTKDGTTSVTFDAAEAEVPQRIYDMVYSDKSADPDALSMGGTDPLPGFFADEYALLPGSIYLRQQMVEQAPEDFEWVTLPPLEGNSQTQAANPQTISIAEESERKEDAMKFVAEFLAPDNMAALAMGDWLVPTGAKAGEALLESTKGEQGWDVAVASADSLVMAPFQTVPSFEEWKSKIATPAFQEYFAGNITLDELGEQLITGGEEVLR